MTTFDINKSCYLCLNEYENLIDVRDEDSKDFYGIDAKLKYILPELLYFGQDVKLRLCCQCLVDVTLFYIFKAKCIKSNDDLYRHLKKKQKKSSQSGSGENSTNENQSKDGEEEIEEEERTQEESKKIRKLQKMWNTPEYYHRLMNIVTKKLEICRLPSSSTTIVNTDSTPYPPPNYVSKPNQNSRVDPTYPTLSQSIEELLPPNILLQKDKSGNMSFVQHTRNKYSQNTNSPSSQNLPPQNTNSSPKPQDTTDQNSPAQINTKPPERSIQIIPSEKVPTQPTKSQSVPSQNLSTIQGRSHQNVRAENTKSQNILPQNLLHNTPPLQNVSPSQNGPVQNLPSQKVVSQNISSQNLPQEKERSQNNFSHYTSSQNQNLPSQNGQTQNLPHKKTPAEDTISQNLYSQRVSSQNTRSENVLSGSVRNKPSENVPNQKIFPQNSYSNNAHSQNLTATQNEQTQYVSRQNVPTTNVEPQNSYSVNGQSQYTHYQNIPEASQNPYHNRYPYYNNVAQNYSNQNVQAQNVHLQNKQGQNIPASHQNPPPYNSNYNWSQPNSTHQNYNWQYYNYWQRQNMQYQNTNYQNAPQNGSNWYPQNLQQSQSTSFNNYNNSYWSQTSPPQNGQTQIAQSQNVPPQTVENSSSDPRMSQNLKENNQPREKLPQNNQPQKKIPQKITNNVDKFTSNLLNPVEPIVIDDADNDDVNPPKDEFISLDFTHTKDLNYSEQPSKKIKLEPSELLFENLNSSENYENPEVKMAKLKSLEDNLKLQENKIDAKDDNKVNHKTINLVAIEKLLNKNKIQIDPSKTKSDEIKIPKPEDKVSNSCSANNEDSANVVKEDSDIKSDKDKMLYASLLHSSPNQNLAKTEENKINIESELDKLFDVLPKKLDTKDILKQEDKMLKSCTEDSLTLKLLVSDKINTLIKTNEDILFRNKIPQNGTCQNTHFQNIPTQNTISQNFLPQNVHLPNNVPENVISQKVENLPQNLYPLNSSTNQKLENEVVNKINSGPIENENSEINMKNDICIEENELVSKENDTKLYEELKKKYSGTQNIPIQNVHPQNDYFPMTQNILSQKLENSLPQKVLSQNVPSRNGTCQNTHFQNIPIQKDPIQNTMSQHFLPQNVNFPNSLSENVLSRKVQSPPQNWHPQNSSTNKRLENEDITNKINSGPIGNENSEINIKNDFCIEENELVSKENDAKLYEELKNEDSDTPNNIMDVDEVNMDIEENKIISDENHSKLYEFLKTEPKTPNCTIEDENYSTVPSSDMDIEENMPFNETDNTINKELKIENEEMIDDGQMYIPIDIEENILKFEQIDKDLYEEIKTSDEFITIADGDDDEIIRCNHCEKRLPKRLMYFHLVVHNRYLCKICKALCDNRDRLRAHHSKFHKNHKYECKICKKAYKTEVYLKSHELTHISELPFKCDKCSKRFGFEYILKQHMKQHNDSEKKYTCLVCDKRFVLSCHLSAHMKQHTHVKRTAWECNICGKIFPRSGNLIQHKFIHKGERKFECPTCGKKFLMHTHLKQHLPIHMDVKEFSCHICQKGFRDKSSLKRHIETHDETRKTKRKEKKEKRKEASEESPDNNAQNGATDKEEDNNEPSELRDKSSLKKQMETHDKKRKTNRKEKKRKKVIEESSGNVAQGAATDKEVNDNKQTTVET